jgi:hypothetical protein
LFARKVIGIMSTLEGAVRLPLSPVPDQRSHHIHCKPPLSPVHSEISFGCISHDSIEAFMPASPTSLLDVRLVYRMDDKRQLHHVETAKVIQASMIPNAISFKPILMEDEKASLEEDEYSTYSEDEDDDNVVMDSDDEEDLLGLDLLGDDDDMTEIGNLQLR